MESSEPIKKGRVRWDEENLTENERVKKELNTTAIEEPKTPYHSPCASQTDLKDMEAEFEEYQMQLDEEMKSAGLVESEHANNEPPRNGSRRVSFDSTAEGHDGTRDNTKFDAMRRQHYSMRDAIQKGKHLIEEEPPEGAAT